MVDHEMLTRERTRFGIDCETLDTEAALPAGTTARIEGGAGATNDEIAALAQALGVLPSDITRKEALMAETTEKVALTPREVAEMTGLSRNTVYEEIASGRLPSVKVGKGKSRFLVSRVALEAWLVSGREAC